MNKNATIDFRNPTIVRNAGVSALKRELGIVGTAYFMRQMNIGKGDYTAEREELLKDLTSDEIAEGILAMRGIEDTYN